MGRSVVIGELGNRVGGPSDVNTTGDVREKVPKMIVTRREAKIVGALDANAVARTIRLHLPDVTSCYQRALKRDTQLSGKLIIRLNVDGTGVVAEATIETNSVGDLVASCILSCAKRWRFPHPEGGNAEVAVPFVFQAAQ